MELKCAINMHTYSYVFNFSVKKEQKPVRTSLHYGFQRTQGKIVAWRYRNMTEKKAGKTFVHSGSIIMLCQILAWNGLKMQWISNVNWKLLPEATVQIIFLYAMFEFIIQ